MKVLIIKPTALGDVAQALRVVPLLKSSGKVSHLSWIVDEDYRPLLELCPEIDEIISFPRRKWRKQFQLREAWAWGKGLERQFDAVLDLQGLARSAWMTWMTGCPRRIGLESAREGARLAYTEVVRDRSRHAVDRYRIACEHLLGSSLEGQRPGSLKTPGASLPAGLMPGEYTVLHPYSLWETKLWAWSNYNELAEAYPGEQFVMVGQGNLFPVTAPNILDLRNATPGLEGLMAILGGARVMISTDSGPAHVAAALGSPVLCLFGATDPGKTSPRGEWTRVLFRDLKCQPCLRRRCQIESKMACLRSLTVSEVGEAWQNLSKKRHFGV